MKVILVLDIVVEKPFFSSSENESFDKVPLMSWNKEENGELFSFSNGTLVGIKGRVENYRNILVIVIESIIYLGAGRKNVGNSRRSQGH